MNVPPPPPAGDRQVEDSVWTPPPLPSKPPSGEPLPPPPFPPASQPPPLGTSPSLHQATLLEQVRTGCRRLIIEPFLRLDRKRKATVLAAVGLVVLVFLARWIYSEMDRVPGNRLLRQTVEMACSGSGQRVVDVVTDTSIVSSDYASCSFTATLELTEGYFTSTVVDRALQERGIDPTVFHRINELLSGEGGARIKELAKLGTSVEGLDGVTILRQTARPGHRYQISGTIRARRGDRGWEAEVAEARPDAGAPTGRRQQDFGPNALALDNPKDAEKIRGIAASANEVLKQLEEARDKYMAEQTARDEQWVVGNLSKIRSGSMFSGVATRSGYTPQSLTLEISEVDTSRRTVSALLRNDGGWAEARRFQGTYEANTKERTFRLTLGTRSDQAVGSCGPFLQWDEAFDIKFILDGDVLNGKTNSWTYRLSYVTDDQKSKEIARVREAEVQWLGATKAGMVYKGTATLVDQAWSEEYLLKFTKQEKNGLVIEAELTARTSLASRKFRGMLVLNSYMAEGKPLRLISDGEQAVKQAGQYSPLRTAGELRWYPQLDQGKLSFDNTSTGYRWHCVFEPLAGKELEIAVLDTKKIDALRQAAATVRELPFIKSAPAGLGIAANDEAAMATLVAAQAAGERTEFCIGAMYMFGRGVEANTDKGLDWINQGIAQGDTRAMAFLGVLYLAGDYIKQDSAKGIRLLQQAGDKGDARAISNLGIAYQYGLGVPRDTAKALELYRRSAERGDPSGMALLGASYIDGVLLQKDVRKGEHWIRKASDMGDPRGRCDLAMLYIKGLGVSKDVESGIKLLRQSADAGWGDAMFNLGRCYSNGIGVTKNDAEAIEWYKKAAAADSVNAMFTLGLLLQAGEGVDKDYAKALEWFRKASGAGDPRAKWAIGEAYRQGRGVPQSDVEAFRWFQAAADGGDPSGCQALAMAYIYGKGVKEDPKLAFRWMKIAADAGVVVSMANLAVMYDNGYGVAADPNEATKWYMRAAQAGNADAKAALKKRGIQPP